MTKTMAFLTAAIVLNGCQSPKYQPVSNNLPRLEIQLADRRWNGEQVPPDQICARDGGKAATPPLRVGNIPPEANAIIIEFNNRDRRALRKNGGLGKIGFWIEQQTEIILLPVEAETLNVEAPAFVESDSRGDSVGYQPPCSGGKGHRYFALVKAVYKPISDEEKARLLAIGKIELGRY